MSAGRKHSNRDLSKEKAIADRLMDPAKKIWEEERASAGMPGNAWTGWDAEATRRILQTFIDNHFSNSYDLTTEIEVVRIIQAVLAVDMNKPANRKGDLPKALRLVTRADAVERCQGRAIYKMVDKARYGLGQVNGRADSVNAVATVLERLGETVDTGTIDKIYGRWLKQGGDAPG
jgi:hypothetical protein